MDYKKKYREALKRARKLYEKGTITESLNYVFPELKESEDEKIRKALIDFFNISAYNEEQTNGVYDKDILAWLEKQGTSYTKKDVDIAYIKGISDAKQEVEKQYKADYQIRKDIATFIFNYKGDIKDRAKWMDYLGVKVYVFENEDERPQGKTAFEAAKEEKVDNQNCVKPTDKVKPRFHEGDWVVQGCNILNIKCVGDEYYCFETVGGYVDDMLVSEIDSLYHLWTIADAEDGDVLYSKKHNLIWIYKDNKHYYASINLNYADVVSFDNEIVFPSDVCPANRVQKSILFQKMEEAGYKWNDEKKELKKVITEPKFHEGEWITFYGGKPFKILKVESEQNGILDYLLVRQDGYVSNYNKKYVDENARLWTIKDAKPGDVLFQDLMDGKTFIYNGINPNMAILFSFIISNDGEDVLPYDIGKPNVGIGYIEENKNIIHPATKEQRELLFQKMKEAGYKWNGEKLIPINEDVIEAADEWYKTAELKSSWWDNGIQYFFAEYHEAFKAGAEWLKSLEK